MGARRTHMSRDGGAQRAASWAAAARERERLVRRGEAVQRSHQKQHSPSGRAERPRHRLRVAHRESHLSTRYRLERARRRHHQMGPAAFIAGGLLVAALGARVAYPPAYHATVHRTWECAARMAFAG